MFCSQCGKELSDDVNFCPDCGSATANAPSPRPSSVDVYPQDDGQPQVVLQPEFVGWVTVLSLLPIQLFMTVWGAGFFGGFSLFAIKAIGLDIPPASPFVFFGSVFFFGIPWLAYTAKKRTYAQTEYRFYKDRLEYAEGFWTAENKTIKYDKITETSMRRGVIQRKYGLGTIYLSTPATGFQRNSSRSGIMLHDIRNPEEVYKTVEQLIGK